MKCIFPPVLSSAIYFQNQFIRLMFSCKVGIYLVTFEYRLDILFNLLMRFRTNDGAMIRTN